MILFPLLALLVTLAPQHDPILVVRYFDQNAAYNTYLFLDPQTNHPLDAELKNKLKRGLSTVKCESGLLAVTLDPSLAREWQRQLRLKDCPGEKCSAKDIRTEIRVVLYDAAARNDVCSSESHTEPPLHSYKDNAER